MLILKRPVLSAKIIEKQIITLIKSGEKIYLSSFDENLDDERKLFSFEGDKGFILEAFDDCYILALDDKLVTVRSGKKDIVLRANASNNFFWHATRSADRFYVQEYGLGESPKGLYVSKNCRNWQLLTTNFKIDRGSRHFHSIVYDKYRKQLIVTLGDYAWKNKIRCCTYDEDGRWKSLYQGPWQFVPIVVLKDQIVFGMDSGMARGGIGVYYPESHWDFTFLRWVTNGVRFVQMCDLRLLENHIWIAALGYPQAIIASRNMKIWYLVHMDKLDRKFNHYMSICEGKNLVTCTTGNSLLLLHKSELEKMVSQRQPIVKEYGAHLDKFKASRFVFPVLKSAHKCKNLVWR